MGSVSIREHEGQVGILGEEEFKRTLVRRASMCWEPVSQRPKALPGTERARAFGGQRARSKTWNDVETHRQTPGHAGHKKALSYMQRKPLKFRQRNVLSLLKWSLWIKCGEWIGRHQEDYSQCPKTKNGSWDEGGDEVHGELWTIHGEIFRR